MDGLRINFDGYDSPTGDTWSALPAFTVQERNGSVLARVQVGISNSAVAQAESRLKSRGLTEEDRGELWANVLLRYGVRYLESILQDPDYRADLLESRDAKYLLTSSDLDPLIELAVEKRCNYQVAYGRDLYCSAAAPTDETAVGKEGLQTLAPTSRPVCQACDLPDADFLCSHLHHPSVTGFLAGGGYDRKVGPAQCDLGRPEVSDASRCCAGGHACWQRIVAFPRERTASLSALSLPEGLDVLDAAWRLAFGRRKRLLALRSATDVAGLTQAASDRDTFQARIDDLADILSSLNVGDELLPEKGEEVDDRGSLNRVQSVLSSKLDDSERAKGLLEPLRHIVGIRNGMTHSGYAKQLPSHSVALDLSWPPSDWSAAWQHVQAVAVDALARIRWELIRIADSE